MFFIPYRFDLELRAIPYLTLLVSALCIAVYTMQYANEQQYEAQTKQFCSKELRTIARMALAKAFGEAGSRVCMGLMYRLETSSDPRADIRHYAAGAEQFASMTQAESQAYVGALLTEQYRSYLREVPRLRTRQLWYQPETWNPLTMVTATFSHGSWGHLIGNLVFFFAFAAAVELVIGSGAFFCVVMIMAIGTGAAYSVAMADIDNPLPTVGLSGVVMGMIAMLAYFMPTARVRCFYWFLIKFGSVAISAWFLAAVYIGLDVYMLLTREALGSVNLIAHVSGAAIGVLLAATCFRGNRRMSLTRG